MEKRQRFTAEFKHEAIRLLKTSGKPAAAVARQLGMPRNRLYQWATDAERKGNQAFPGSGRPKASQEELAVLKREVARLKEENDAKNGVRFTYGSSGSEPDPGLRHVWPHKAETRNVYAGT